MNTIEEFQPPPADTTVWMLVFVAWLVAAISTTGALFLGEVMNLPTCVLCWYQRIFMFPLALLLPVGLVPFDRNVIRYALPMAVPGGLVAGYHQLLLVGIVPQSLTPCTQGVPCTDKAIEWWGFVTIPLLSVIAFSTIVALLLIAYRRGVK